MDKDSCNYILHTCSYIFGCYPCSHPFSRFLKVWAFGSSDTTGTPNSAICIHPLLADTTSDSFHHAVQPPVQPSGEKEEEVVCCKSWMHNIHTCFDSAPSPLGRTPVSCCQCNASHQSIRLPQEKFELAWVYSSPLIRSSFGRSLNWQLLVVPGLCVAWGTQQLCSQFQFCAVLLYWENELLTIWCVTVWWGRVGGGNWHFSFNLPFSKRTSVRNLSSKNVSCKIRNWLHTNLQS